MARSGQVCIAASRVYVQKSIAKEFIERYRQKMLYAVKSMGDPEDPNVAYGPLVDKISFERVKGMLERAKGEAELVVGGGTISNSGCFIEPTVFINPKPGAEIVTDEVFGPVSVIDTFETEEEVLAKVNDTEFGLMAGVFTRDITRALRVSSKFESGVVGINCVSYVSILQVVFPRSRLLMVSGQYTSSPRWIQGFRNWARVRIRGSLPAKPTWIGNTLTKRRSYEHIRNQRRY